MTTDADRIRDAIARLGTTQRGLARLLDVDERLVRRWCAGSIHVPRIVWLAVAGLLAERPRPPVH